MGHHEPTEADNEQRASLIEARLGLMEALGRCERDASVESVVALVASLDGYLDAERAWLLPTLDDPERDADEVAEACANHFRLVSASGWIHRRSSLGSVERSELRLVQRLAQKQDVVSIRLMNAALADPRI